MMLANSPQCDCNIYSVHDMSIHVFIQDIPGRMPGEPTYISDMHTVRDKLSERVVVAANHTPTFSQKKSEL